MPCPPPHRPTAPPLHHTNRHRPAPPHQVANLCNEAALRAAALNATHVTMTHFSEALDRIQGGLVRSRVMAPQDRHRTAIHEAGHAVVAWFSTNANPPVKASIVWRGETLGFVQSKSLERISKVSG